MFNIDQKERYLKNVNEGLKNFYLQIFNSMSFFEESAGKDICNFTTVEIIEWYKFLFTPSLERLVNINSKMEDYQRWCLSESLVNDGQNHFSEINLETLGACINKTIISQSIISREVLLEKIKELINPRERFVLLGLFEGIGAKGNDNEEFLNAHFTDIVDNKIHLCTGRVIDISDDLKKIAKESNEQKAYYTATGQKKELVGDTIIKDTVRLNSDSKNMGLKIYKLFSKSRDYIGLYNKTSMKKIMDSGVINYLNIKAKEYNMEVKQLLYEKDILEYLNNQYCYNKQSNLYFIKKYNDFLI